MSSNAEVRVREAEARLAAAETAVVSAKAEAEADEAAINGSTYDANGEYRADMSYARFSEAQSEAREAQRAVDEARSALLLQQSGNRRINKGIRRAGLAVGVLASGIWLLLGAPLMIGIGTIPALNDVLKTYLGVGILAFAAPVILAEGVGWVFRGFRP